MSAKDGRGVKSGERPSRRHRRTYRKCRKHAECRSQLSSIWRKR
jgi:hypothetical protein